MRARILECETITLDYLSSTGETYEIKIDIPEEAGIPKGSELHVTEISELATNADGEKYVDAAAEVLDLAEEDVKYVKLLDIYITKDGEKIQPKAPVSVKIKLLDKYTASEKDVVDSEENNSARDDADIIMQVVHFGNETETLKCENDNELISFETEGFSVFAIVSYTVDFHYLDFDFSLLGGKSIYLSELLSKLGIKGSIADVESVTFSNEALLNVEKKENDWLLTSLKSFGTKEKLTIRFKNGYVYEIEVVDPDVYYADFTVGISAFVDELLLNMVDGLTSENLVSVDSVTLTDPTGQLHYDHSTHALTPYGEIDSSDNVSASVTYTYKDAENQDVQATISVAITAENTPAGQTIPYHESSIMHGTHYENEAANEWQTSIDYYRYQGNTASYKITSPDKAVRIQKNVIPTGIENEFLVYLGVDVSEALVVQKIISGIGTVYTPSNPLPNYGDIWGENNAAKAEIAISTGKQGNMRGFVTEPDATNNKKWTIHVRMPNEDGTFDDNSQVIDIIRYAQFDSFNNGHLVMKIAAEPAPSGTWITVGAAAKSNASGDGYETTLDLDARAIKIILSYYGADVDIGSVFDGMGAQSITTVVEQAHTELTGAEVTINDYMQEEGDGGKSVAWNVGTATLHGYVTDGYFTNVAELLYKVTLDVTADGFQSGSWYDTNNNATLTYTKTDGTSGTVDFPKPKVRGSIYSFEFEKVDQDDNPLAGAQFTLVGPADNPDVDSTSKSYTTTGATGEKIVFSNLPWGQYTLTETPPKGYRAGEGNPWTMYIGYTGDGSSKYGQYLTPASPGIVTSEGAKYLNTEWATDGVWKIVNKWNKITFTKEVAVHGDLTLADVDHTIYIALWHGGNDGDYLRDDQGNIITKEIVITNGVPEPKTVTFENIDTDFYDIDELVAVDGTRLRVGDEWENSEGDTIMLAAIQGNNDADLTTSNTADVTLTNVYSHPTTIDFTANKKWADSKWTDITANPPAGATVTFEIYRCLEGEDPDTDSVKVPSVEPIVLDGKVDDTTEGNGEFKSWEATFKDLPRDDGEGHKYIYSVKEIACSDADYQCFANQYDTTPMGDKHLTSNGGYIWNKQKTTSIVVKKEDDKNLFLPGAKFKFYKVETDDVGSHDVQIGDEFTVPEDGFTFNDLISGTYKLVETKTPEGYIILTSGIVFKVNATGNGDVIQWLDGEKPDDVKDLSGTNNNTITIINTPGVQLPATGGPGNLIYTLSGLILLTGSVIGLSMRRRERRLN